ncbi:ANTAR domain-containing protein [Cellulomonas sp. 179-A 4D5 NHS]|uniref:ANTAR domain-containing protein n=1 Tax=Cellulomonas sp. 179-A 4D5 NHS TaxID=3142378 RepID=UPI0039A03E99
MTLRQERARATIELQHVVVAPTSLQEFVQEASDVAACHLDAVVVVVEVRRPGGPRVTSRPPDGPEPVVNLARALSDGTRVDLCLYSAATPVRRVVELAEVYLDVIAHLVPLRLHIHDLEAVTADLRAAAESRSVIDQATGVIMRQNHCTAHEAFSILRSASQNRNIKLREVAASLVEDLSATAAAPASQG